MVEMSILSGNAQNANDLLNKKKKCFVDKEHHLEGAVHLPLLVVFWAGGAAMGSQVAESWPSWASSELRLSPSSGGVVSMPRRC